MLGAVVARPAASSTDEGPLDVGAFVAIVLRAHPGASQARALDAAAAAERKVARLIADPEVSFSGGRGSPMDRLVPGGTETAFSVTLTIPWPGTYAAGVRGADLGADALRSEGVLARWELEVDARAAFMRLLYARAALEIARAAEADALGLRDLTARRAQLGESRETERLKAEVEWLRQQRTRRAAEREEEAAEAVLRTLAVEPLPRPLVLAGELPSAFSPADAAELRARLQASNPRLASARAAAARGHHLLSVARHGRFPGLDVTWFGSREVDKTTSGLALGVRVPLWNANRGEIARAQAASSLASATAERVLVELVAALEQARADLEIASSQAEMLNGRILPAALRSLDISRFGYQEGETSLLDLLDAQRTYREAQREAVAARLALALALAQVQRLIGPDFNPET